MASHPSVSLTPQTMVIYLIIGASLATVINPNSGDLSLRDISSQAAGRPNCMEQNLCGPGLANRCVFPCRCSNSFYGQTNNFGRCYFYSYYPTKQIIPPAYGR